MNEQVKELIAAVGALGELWGITYTGFLKQGMNKTEARAHTKDFMSCLMHEIMTYGGAK